MAGRDLARQLDRVHGRPRPVVVLPVFGSGFRQHAVIDKGCAGDVKKVPVSDQVAATR